MAGHDPTKRIPYAPRNRLGDLVVNKPDAGPQVLTPRYALLIDYMVHGCTKADLVDPFGYPVDTPLTLIQAADVLRIKRRHARQLVQTPLISNALAKAVNELRSGARAQAVHTMIDVMNDKGTNKPADRKVRLTGAAMVMGEAQAGQASVHVNVAVQTPGYVIILPPDDAEPPTIDATAEPT